jgi:methyl-accepting chemotaxis protein
MMNTLSFRARMILLLATAVVGVVLMGALSVWQARNQLTDGRRGQLVTGVESMHAIIEGYRAQAAAGKLSDEAARKAAMDATRQARYSDGGKDYFYIFSLDGKGVMHPIKPEWDGQDLNGKVKDGNGADLLVALTQGLRESADGRAFVMTNFPRPGQSESVPKLQYIMKVDGWNWMIGSGLYIDDLNAMVLKTLMTNALIALAVLAVIGGVGWATLRSVMRQIGGEPAEAAVAMRAVAEGDLTVSLPRVVPGSLLADLGEMIAALRGTVSQVRGATDNISTASTQIATGNQDLSARTEQTASSLQETAASMEELTGTVRQSADAARTATQLAESAANIARRGGTVVGEVVTTMQSINDASRKINDIIGVIDGIAFQTNILALNAAVEAARAGEQGRGFAVVAGEVRNLAQRSAEAAKEIKALIGASVDRVEAGSRLVGDAGKTMDEIVASVQRVTDVISEISAATGEQSQGIGQVGTAVSQLDQMTQQNAALVE